ncbi:hypothetical protein SCLCIDRAFT_630031 [Scleroderma citrinum Foug A]|uniref:Major facilitator superfamily (MFS) profile domain-containing protein n=1 Tax=Scleroderma citrinum Foug A TaxID=1036808 RepID=A0A0C2ZS86_9AGAM|nr:hypothetical protein SCLCIDRAFT_630031 [Scleroderma citrinum Foug A]
MAGYLIEIPIIGRRRTLAVFTALTGVFVLLSTTASTSNAVNGWNCGVNYASTIMYGVLFALSLELLPIKARGTGYAMVFIVNCICNAMASIIGLYANINTPLPLWFSGAVLVLAGFIALFFGSSLV